MSFFDDSASGFAPFGGDGGFLGSSTGTFGTSSASSKGGEGGRSKPEGRRSGGPWSGGDSSGFWSEEGASFSSPAPSQAQGGSTFQRRGGSGGTSSAAVGGGGLIYATVGMLLRAADEAATNRRSRTQLQGGSKEDAEAPEESTSSNNTGSVKLQLHGQEITTVGLRGWVSAAGAQHLPSAVRFVLCDGTGEIDVEVGLVEGRPWWGDSSGVHGGQTAAAGGEEAAAAALWNFPSGSSSPLGAGKKKSSGQDTAERDTPTREAAPPVDVPGGGAAQEQEEDQLLHETSCSKKTEQLSSSGMKKFLDPGSLVRVTGALLLLANDGTGGRRRKSQLHRAANNSSPTSNSSSSSADSDEENAAEEDQSSYDTPRVYLEAITCAPIKDPREFSVLHPVEIAFAAATFLSRSGRLQQPAAILEAPPAAGIKRAKLQSEEDNEFTTSSAKEEKEDESAKNKGEDPRVLAAAAGSDRNSKECPGDATHTLYGHSTARGVGLLLTSTIKRTADRNLSSPSTQTTIHQNTYLSHEYSAAAVAPPVLCKNRAPQALPPSVLCRLYYVMAPQQFYEALGLLLLLRGGDDCSSVFRCLTDVCYLLEEVLVFEHPAKQYLKVLQQEYGHLEDPVQQKVILFLLQHGDSEKRVSRQHLLSQLCTEAAAGQQRCSTEEVEKALQELEEAAETIEHAGLVALAC